VELLVVIGIIALLISILLPALNKARQQATLVDCQARLRQMGNMLAIYENENRQLLPWGVFARTATPDNKETIWWWNFAMSDQMNHKLIAADGLAENLSPIFRDRDTIDVHDNYWVCHYTANPTLLRAYNLNDPGGLPTVQRKITEVRQASNTFVIWDGPQISDPAVNYNAYGVAYSIDEWGLPNVGLSLDNPNVHGSGLPIFPGQIGTPGNGNGAGVQKKNNIDFAVAFGGSGWVSHLRFRHLQNTALNALCLDGHIEMRKVGTVLRKDIYTNATNQY
jgi:type II secretory pathway pseudopilin PulG